MIRSFIKKSSFNRFISCVAVYPSLISNWCHTHDRVVTPQNCIGLTNTLYTMAAIHKSKKYAGDIERTEIGEKDSLMGIM